MESLKALMTLKEVAQCLAVSQETVYRLVKSGQLPGIKAGGNWRFSREDVERFVCRRVKRFGLIAVKPLFYRADVLKRYQAKPEEYYLHEGAFNGIFGVRYGLHHQQCGLPLKPGEFCEIPFWVVEIKRKVIVLDPEKFDRLPEVEQGHWGSYRIPEQDIEEIP